MSTIDDNFRYIAEKINKGRKKGRANVSGSSEAEIKESLMKMFSEVKEKNTVYASRPKSKKRTVQG